MSELTAKCQGPQSCLPISKGMFLVLGKEISKVVLEMAVCSECVGETGKQGVLFVEGVGFQAIGNGKTG
jgi:hypothetical protein